MIYYSLHLKKKEIHVFHYYQICLWKWTQIIEDFRYVVIMWIFQYSKYINYYYWEKVLRNIRGLYNHTLIFIKKYMYLLLLQMKTVIYHLLSPSQDYHFIGIINEMLSLGEGNKKWNVSLGEGNKKWNASLGEGIINEILVLGWGIKNEMIVLGGR
jgi:hypothetical protein